MRKKAEESEEKKEHPDRKGIHSEVRNKEQKIYSDVFKKIFYKNGKMNLPEERMYWVIDLTAMGETLPNGDEIEYLSSVPNLALRVLWKEFPKELEEKIEYLIAPNLKMLEGFFPNLKRLSTRAKVVIKNEKFPSLEEVEICPPNKEEMEKIKKIQEQTSKQIYKITKTKSMGFSYEKIEGVSIKAEEKWEKINKKKLMNIYVNGILVEV